MTKILILIAFITTCGCTAKGEIYHGYTFNDVEKINELITTFKSSNKKDVELKLGTPTFIETDINSKTYFYVEDVFQKTPLIGEDKLYSRVLRIDFDHNDQVMLVDMYKIIGKGDFNNQDKTKIIGYKMGFFEQMKRNLMSIGQSDE